VDARDALLGRETGLRLWLWQRELFRGWWWGWQVSAASGDQFQFVFVKFDLFCRLAEDLFHR
jgi:hypothetical protein